MRLVWISFLLFSLGLVACSFAPDLSAYPECSPSGYCAPGCTCFEGQVCVPEDSADRFRPPSFCDPRNSCAADLLNDPLNCGECGNVCQVENASAFCDHGVCRMGDCNLGWGDCDETNRLGCFDSLKEREHCGECGNECTEDAPYCECVDDTSPCEDWECVDRCDPPKTDCDGSCINMEESYDHCGGCDQSCGGLLNVDSAECYEGACRILDCTDDFGNCDTQQSTGCETPLGTLGNCGGCHDSCRRVHSDEPSCVDGDCVFVCDDGWDDCNRKSGDGCEVQLGTMENCLTCYDACGTNHATAQCLDTGCVFECDTGWGDCNGNPADGCEESLGSQTHCTGCWEGCGTGYSCLGVEVGCEQMSCDPTCALGIECIDGVCGGEGLYCSGSPCLDGVCCVGPMEPGFCSSSTCDEDVFARLGCDSSLADCPGEFCCLLTGFPPRVASCSIFELCVPDEILCATDAECFNIPGRDFFHCCPYPPVSEDPFFSICSAFSCQ